MLKIITGIIIGLIIGLTFNAQAATNTYQPDATAGKDTYIFSGGPTTNFGTANPIFMGQFLGGTYKTIIEFDISDIRAGSTINTATLDLNIESTINGGGSLAAHVYRIIRSDWEELQATWNIYKTSNNWTTAGAGSDGNDYTSTNGVAFDLRTSAGTLTITGLANLAQDALDNQSGKLILLLQKDSAADSQTNSPSSSDSGTAGNRPKLTVDYTEAPEEAPRISTGTPTSAENDYYTVTLLIILATIITLDTSRKLIAKHINP